MLKKIIPFVFFICCFFIAGWFCRKQTDGFTILKISSNLPFCEEWKVGEFNPEEKNDLRKMLDQPFSYLAKGEQCYVFASEDKKYVLKFFRQNHRRAPWWVQVLPSFFDEFKRRIEKEKHAKLIEDFFSYKLAYETLKEETGLIFLHLNKSQDLKMTVPIIDKLGILHPISLDSMEFLLQKRADPLYPSLEKMIREKEVEQAKSLLSNLVHLLYKIRVEKGILDLDPDLNINFGSLGQIPIEIDVGRFKKAVKSKDRKEVQEEIVHITDNLHQFLESRSNVLDQHLKDEIAKLGKS